MYTLSLELTDAGFDHSVLSELRDRLLEEALELQLLDRILERLQTQGWLKARGTQRSGSTQELTVAREMTRLEFLGGTLRFTLNMLATVIPNYLQAQIPVEWNDRYSCRVEDSRLPKLPEHRHERAAQIGADGTSWSVLMQIRLRLPWRSLLTLDSNVLSLPCHFPVTSPVYFRGLRAIASS